MVAFALKGAVFDYPQLDGRARFFAREGLPLRLELHTFGPRDLYDPVARRACLDSLARLQDTHGPADLTVHIPFQDVGVVTKADFDADQVADTLDFADRCGAPRIVMHRYWALVHGPKPARCDREEATAGFAAVVAGLARQAPGITLLVENMGHYFLASRRPDDYLAGPIDHFFPWEIAAFRADMLARGIANVEPFVDVAHATLSANLFNFCRSHRAAGRADPRCRGIVEDDLDRAERLHPFDFVDPAMPWLHVSDSHFVSGDAPAELPPEALNSEGQELGAGNLPFALLPVRLADGRAETVLTLEVDPARGESHADNGAQCRSLTRLRALFAAHQA